VTLPDSEEQIIGNLPLCAENAILFGILERTYSYKYKLARSPV